MSADFEQVVNKTSCEPTIQSFECPICLNLVMDPKQCTKCETIFCGSCIEACNKKSNVCPYKCENMQTKEIGRHLRQMLEKLLIRCQKCRKQVAYNIYTTHAKNCIQNEEIKCKECMDYKESLNEQNSQIEENLKKISQLEQEKKLFFLENEKLKKENEILIKQNEELKNDQGRKIFKNDELQIIRIGVSFILEKSLIRSYPRFEDIRSMKNQSFDVKINTITNPNISKNSSHELFPSIKNYYKKRVEKKEPIIMKKCGHSSDEKALSEDFAYIFSCCSLKSECYKCHDSSSTHKGIVNSIQCINCDVFYQIKTMTCNSCLKQIFKIHQQ